MTAARIIRAVLLAIMVPISWAIVSVGSLFVPGSPTHEMAVFSQTANSNHFEWSKFESHASNLMVWDATAIPFMMAVLVALAAVLLRAANIELISPIIVYMALYLASFGIGGSWVLTVLGIIVFGTPLALVFALARRRRRSLPSASNAV